MGKVLNARIELFINQRVGQKSGRLEDKFSKYASRMKDLKIFEKISEGQPADSPKAKLEFLVMEYEVSRRLDSIESLLPYLCTSPAMCRMAQDEDIHNEDLKKVLRGFREEAVARIRDIYPSREAVSDYLDNVVSAATQILLLRKDLTHAILAVRALKIRIPDAVLEFLKKPEFADLIPHAKGGLKWSRHVELLEEQEQHAVTRELIRVLDPLGCKTLMDEIYAPGLSYREEETPDYRIPEFLSQDYDKPKKKKKNGKKNGNGKNGDRKEIRYEVEFPEDVQKIIREEGFDPSELGNAIVYSFNLAGSKKAIGNVHFSRDKFESNVRRVLPKNFKEVLSFLKKYDLILFHKGATKDDVSFNIKPDNDAGSQIATAVSAYIKTVLEGNGHI